MIVGIIPARGSSKGIPEKNLKDFGGKALVRWTMEAAAKSELLDRVYLSSEDSRLLVLADNQRVFALERPPELSEDRVQVDEVTLFALRQLQWSGLEPTAVVVLQPTSPFRTSVHIDEAIQHYQNINESKYPYVPKDTVFSAYQPERYHYLSDTGVAIPIGHRPATRLGRQDIDPTEVVVENGAIYIVEAERLSSERTMRAQPMVSYDMPYWDSIEVDDDIDWMVAERLCDIP
jgi:CMP-N,N'-diacetyllegionaminic acid synthase